MSVPPEPELDGAASAVASSVPILLVDDNPSKRLAMKAVLAPLGHTVVEAGSGVEALRCVMARDFAVILLDVRMPIMDGFATASLIRQRSQCEMTPIIFITAFSSDEIDNSDRYAAGAVDFMSAPVPPNELRAKVSVFAGLFVRARELAARAREVDATVLQLRQLTDAAPIGIFRTDTENRYVYTNPRWSEIAGISSEDAVGQPWDLILSSEERAGLLGDLPESSEHRGELSHRFEIGVPESPSRIVVVTARTIPDLDGEATGWVGTLADITAEAGAEAAMSAARDKATEASRLKSDFLANMSHEIRTPMNGVLGMTDLLLETNLDAVQRDYAQTVRNSGEALLTIINDILDFSKVEAGKVEVEDIAFEPRIIVAEVMGLMSGPAQIKGLDLAAAIDGSLSRTVSGDPGRLRQVLTNLIANAIKFTHDGEIEVRVSATEGNGSDAVVRFEVSDTGDGIESHKLAEVFQPFVQADTSTSRKYGGTGLGLAISSRLVVAMGGECGVSSRIGIGSDFWFTIRVGVRPSSPDEVPRGTAATVEEVAAQREPRSSEPAESGLLLLAEDNLINQKVAVAMLTGVGYRVDTVPNGAAAVEAINTRSYDAILMDCQMPEMNGYEATAAIRAHEGGRRHTPIIAITAGARREDRDRCLAAGMDSYLSKPVSKDALLALVARSLSDRSSRHAPPNVLLLAPDETDNGSAIDLSVLAELRALGDDVGQDLLGDLVLKFVSDTEPLLAEAREALDASDAGRVGRIAHTLKGSAGQLGGLRLAAAFGRLEAQATDGRPFEGGHDDLQEAESAFQELRGALTGGTASPSREEP